MRGATADSLADSIAEEKSAATRVPLFFRQLVLDRLNEELEQPIHLDVTRPFADPVNREAAEGLTRFREGRITP